MSGQLPWFYAEWTQLEDDTWDYCVFDRRRGDFYLAACGKQADAEKVVAALNAAEPRPEPVSLGIFG